MSNFLDVDSINVYYGGIHALQDVSIHIDEGEIVSVVGANGAGKSTLLNMITGALENEWGEISRKPMLGIGYLRQNSGLEGSSLRYINAWVRLRNSVNVSWIAMHLASDLAILLSGNFIVLILQ